MSNSDWLSALGLIPPFLGAAFVLIDHVGSQRRKTVLEMIKLKLEIESIRRSQQFNLPEVSVTAEDLTLLQSPVGTHFDLFAPESLRKSRWYQVTHNHPRWGRWFASFACALAGFYGAILPFAVSIAFDEGIGPLGFRVALAVTYVLMSLFLILLSVRIYRARKLALNELHPSPLQK